MSPSCARPTRDRDPIPRQAATSEATSAAVRSLFAVVENYPELRSAENVRALQEEISRLEDVIADRRELYNDQVFRYNTRIGQVPAKIVARPFGWTPAPFFTADDDERSRPAVGLDRPDRPDRAWGRTPGRPAASGSVTDRD